MNSARLLLVDDEPALGDLLKRFLERHGYAVDTFRDAESALLALTQDPARYALLITDLTLPGMSGEELVVKVREQTPTLPAIIASGYPYLPQWERVVFVQKPFLPKMLSEEIEQLLKGRSA
ncbi:MAG: response regulator [Bryobacteraceae bacterium]